MQGLIPYDYYLFAGIFALFSILLLISFLARRKFGLAIFLVLLAFIILTVGSVVGYIQMHKYLFPTEISDVSVKKLSFNPAIVVKGKVKNISQYDFSTCTIDVNLHKGSSNKYKNYLYSFQSLKHASIVEKDIKKGEIRAFKLIVEPFEYKHKYSTTYKASCVK